MGYIEELKKIKVSRGAVHKPLLLLLMIGKIKNGHTNKFLYDNIEGELRKLLDNYSLKNLKRQNPQYPFVYLTRESKLYEGTISRGDLNTPDAATVGEVRGHVSNLNPDFLAYINRSPEHLKTVVNTLIDFYGLTNKKDELLEDVKLTGVL